jgi:hypothetical protein
VRCESAKDERISHVIRDQFGMYSAIDSAGRIRLEIIVLRRLGDWLCFGLSLRFTECQNANGKRSGKKHADDAPGKNFGSHSGASRVSIARNR